MKKYDITITETLVRHVDIEADSREEALEKANEQYENSEIVLDADDYTSTLIEVFKEKEESIEDDFEDLEEPEL